MANRPAAELTVDEHLVRALLSEQAPHLASESLALLDRGFDNTNWRLGEHHIVRIPHRLAAAGLIEAEQRWLNVLAPQLELAIPAPTFAGRPIESAGFAWHWSVVPWVPGTDAARAELTAPATTAQRLGTFFDQLHVPAPPDAPVNPYRGGPLTDRAEHFNARIATLGNRLDIDHARSEFAAAVAAAPSTERVWLHGDLHTRNMIISDGELASIIDWGDICTGDRATDLAGAFMLVPNHIDAVRDHAGADDAAWQRARGWALHFATMYLTNADDDPIQAGVGIRLMRALGLEID